MDILKTAYKLTWYKLHFTRLSYIHNIATELSGIFPSAYDVFMNIRGKLEQCHI